MFQMAAGDNGGASEDPLGRDVTKRFALPKRSSSVKADSGMNISSGRGYRYWKEYLEKYQKLGLTVQHSANEETEGLHARDVEIGQSLRDPCIQSDNGLEAEDRLSRSLDTVAIKQMLHLDVNTGSSRLENLGQSLKNDVEADRVLRQVNLSQSQRSLTRRSCSDLGFLRQEKTPKTSGRSSRTLMLLQLPSFRKNIAKTMGLDPESENFNEAVCQRMDATWNANFCSTAHKKPSPRRYSAISTSVGDLDASKTLPWESQLTGMIANQKYQAGTGSLRMSRSYGSLSSRTGSKRTSLKQLQHLLEVRDDAGVLTRTLPTESLQNFCENDPDNLREVSSHSPQGQSAAKAGIHTIEEEGITHVSVNSQRISDHESPQHQDQDTGSRKSEQDRVSFSGGIDIIPKQNGQFDADTYRPTNVESRKNYSNVLREQTTNVDNDGIATDINCGHGTCGREGTRAAESSQPWQSQLQNRVTVESRTEPIRCDNVRTERKQIHDNSVTQQQQKTPTCMKPKLKPKPKMKDSQSAVKSPPPCQNTSVSQPQQHTSSNVVEKPKLKPKPKLGGQLLQTASTASNPPCSDSVYGHRTAVGATLSAGPERTDKISENIPKCDSSVNKHKDRQPASVCQTSNSSLPINQIHQTVASCQHGQTPDSHGAVNQTHPVADSYSAMGSKCRVDGHHPVIQSHAPTNSHQTTNQNRLVADSLQSVNQNRRHPVNQKHQTVNKEQQPVNQSHQLVDKHESVDYDQTTDRPWSGSRRGTAERNQTVLNRSASTSVTTRSRSTGRLYSDRPNSADTQKLQSTRKPPTGNKPKLLVRHASADRLMSTVPKDQRESSHWSVDYSDTMDTVSTTCTLQNRESENWSALSSTIDLGSLSYHHDHSAIRESPYSKPQESGSPVEEFGLRSMPVLSSSGKEQLVYIILLVIPVD